MSVASALELSETIRDQACQLFRSAQNEELLPGRSIEAMAESASRLTEYGVTFERMDWRGDATGAEFRDVTMDMESRGPNDYDTSAIAERLDGVEFLVVHKAPVSRAVFERGEGQDLSDLVGGASVYEDPHGLVSKSDIDVVWITYRNDETPAIVETAVEHGVHVISEKPIGRTAADLESIATSAAANVPIPTAGPIVVPICIPSQK